MSFLASLFGVDGGQAGSEDRYFFPKIYGPRTVAGPMMNEHLAMNLPTVYAAVRIIADSIACVPVEVIRHVGEERIPQPDHPIANLLQERINPYVSAIWGRKTIQARALLWGNGHFEVQRNRGGDPVALWPLTSATRQEAVRDRDGRVIGRQFRTMIENEEHLLPTEDVLHVAAVSLDAWNGMSQVHLHRETLGDAVAQRDYGSRFFRNDAKSGGVVTHPATLSKQAQQNIRDSFQEQGGPENAHKIKVLDEGMKFIPTTIPPEDAQFLGTRTFSVEEIARIFGVPLYLLQNHAKDTSWGSGISEQMLGFVKTTLYPWYAHWEQEANYKLLSEKERRAGFRVKHNLDALLRGDVKTRADYYTKALNPQTGWMNRDEVRSLEDLNPDDSERVNVQVIPEDPQRDTNPGG